jgi:diguanylate cyclase (GGDEF)-like protein
MTDRLRHGRHVVTVVLITLAGFAYSPTRAAQLNLHHYDTRDGIPQIQVSSVHQDPAGYLWIGTYGGLARYNGNRFTVFRGESGLSTSYINVVDSAPDGTVWVGTARGLCRKTGATFDCFTPTGMDQLMVNDVLVAGDRILAAADEGVFGYGDGRLEPLEQWTATSEPGATYSLAVDALDRVWIAAQAGLFVLESGRAERVSLPSKDPPVYDLEVHRGQLWVGTAGRLFALDTESRAVVEHELPLPEGARISDIEFDADGRLWLATPEGLVRGFPGSMERLTTREGLPNNRMLGVIQDREGLVWLATDQGLVKILPGPFEGYSADSGLLASFVRTINEDDRQRLWLGTREGLQIVPRIDGRWDFGAATMILREDGLPDSRVYSVAFGEPGTAWIATAQGVVRWQEGQGVTGLIDRESGLPEQEVHAVLIDRRQRLWISSTQGIRYREDGELRTPDNPELAGAFALRIREDAAGRLWFSTLRDGLLVRSPGGEVRQYLADDGLTDEMLWDLAPSADGSMWVGSNGDGIFRVWPDGRIDQVTSEDGLPDDSVWQVLEDDEGRVWAYTNRGLSRMHEGEFVNYTERDGLLHLEGGATGAFQSSDGLLWFASADGLMRYDAQREYRNTLPPPVVIESARLDREAVRAGERLPYRSGSLSFDFAGLSFQDEDAVRFRYRLVGATDQWSEPTDNHQVTYANLGHGDYVFEVTAANPDGVWSREPARFPFRVATPFWANAWFFVAAAVALAILVWFGVHLRLRHIEANRRRLQQVVDQRTAELSEANRRLKRTARTDQLTGLPNRRYLFDRIGDDVAQSRRAHFEGELTNGDVAFLMIDLDDFKRINDDYGHDAGDSVLLSFSKVLSSRLRESDYMIRWGGEEFMVVACRTEAGEACQIAERIMSAVRATEFSLGEGGERIAVTCSVGIACYPFGEPADALDWGQVVKLADVAVYQAKADGRDCWVQLSPGERFEIADGEDFVQAVKADAEALIDRGVLRRSRGG